MKTIDAINWYMKEMREFLRNIHGNNTKIKLRRSQKFPIFTHDFEASRIMKNDMNDTHWMF